MTLEADLFAALRSLVDDRVYQDTFPQSPAIPTWPSIRYTVIGGVATPDICGGGLEGTDDIRIQIDAVALSSKERNTLRVAVRNALLGFTPPAVIDATSQSSYDSETKTFISTQDFIFYGSST